MIAVLYHSRKGKQRMDTSGAMNAGDYANAGWIIALFAWIISHLESIHIALQIAVLLIGAVSGIMAGLYHWKMIRRMDR